MKKAVLNIDGYIGGVDMFSIMSGEKNFNLSMLKDFLNNLDSDVTDIHVFINSGGGSVIEGWAIYDKLKASGKKITTIGEGIVGSIATVIFMAGSERKLHENTSFFIHNPYWSPDSPTPMEADDLSKLSDELKAEETKILDFYSKVTGTEISVIEPLMKQSTSLTSEQAIELGFANGIINEQVQARKYKIAACIDIKQNKTKMDNNKLENIGNGIDKLTKMFASFFKRSFKNMEFSATNSAGESVNIMIEGEGEDMTGKSVFVVDSEGNQTAAPDETYTLGNGMVLVVEAGLVKEATMPQADKTDAEKLAEAQAELAALKAEKEALQASLTEKENTINDMTASANELKNEFENVKNTIIGAGIDFKSGQIQGKKQQVQATGNMAYMDSVAGLFKK